MAENNVDVVRRGYEAYRRGDFAAIFALLHPEIEIRQTELLPWGGRYHGYDGARQFFGALNRHTEALPEPTEYIEGGDTVAAVGRLRGRVRANDNAFDLAIVHLWTLRNGQAVRFEAYIDTPGMLSALAAG